MIHTLTHPIRRYVSSGNERSVKAKRNILLSVLLKGVSIVIGLAFVPIILDYLDPERYGIWLTLSSIIAWASFFDFGLGNGLRNRMAEAIAQNDYELARTYVSTTYGILAIVFTVILLLFFAVNPFLDWQQILNTREVGNAELSAIAIIVFTFFVLRFFFNLIGVILLAHQRPALNNSFNPIANVLCILLILVLKATTQGSLIWLSVVLSAVPVLVLMVATVIFFAGTYRRYRPSLRYFDLSRSRGLLSLGVKFFYLQLAGIIFFSTANILIAQATDQETVAAYNVAYKYFFMVNMFQGIILTPFWSAVTDAYAKDDMGWIRQTLRKLNRLSVLMILGLIVLLLICPYVYSIWIGDELTIPFSLNLIIALYLIQQAFLAPYSQFLNGFGKLKLSLIVLTAKIVLFVPLTWFLSSGYGAVGVVAAMLLIQLPSLILEPMQVYRLIHHKANGIWKQ